MSSSSPTRSCPRLGGLPRRPGHGDAIAGGVSSGLLEVGKDPRLVEVILRGSRAVVRQRPGTPTMETRHGWICANAGVDRSNVAGEARRWS